MMRVCALAAILLTFLACSVRVLDAREDDPRAIPLVDQHGMRFRLKDLRGSPVLVTFVATRCSDACPIATAMYSRLNERLHRARVAATLVEVTLDPAYDTPFVMQHYAHTYGAGNATWRLASGTPSDVRALMRAFGVTAEKNASGVPDLHSSFVYFLDARGKMSRTLMLSTNLVDDALRIVATTRRS
jgi:cytochrome oxidase Cu insertion factor (SCO1/SenC/PrrC family)